MTKTLSLVPPNQGTIPSDPADTGLVATLTLDMSVRANFPAQVQLHLSGVGNISEVTQLIPPGQPVAALLAVAALDRLAGSLPAIALVPFRSSEVVGWFDARSFRHDQVRPRRTEFRAGDIRPGFTVLDGAGRGLTDGQRSQLASQFGCGEADIRVAPAPAGQVDIPALADPSGSEAGRLLEGVISALKAAGVTFTEMNQGRVLFLPPGGGIGAIVQALCLYGLTEVWVRTIRLAMTDPGQFQVAEIVDPQAMRLWADTMLRAAPAVTLSGIPPEGFRAALVALAAEYGVEFRG